MIQEKYNSKPIKSGEKIQNSSVAKKLLNQNRHRKSLKVSKRKKPQKRRRKSNLRP